MALNRDALNQELELSRSNRGSGVNFVGKGTVKLRIVEFVDGDGVTRFARKVVKWGSGVGKRKDCCVNRAATFDAPDAFERRQEQLEASGQGDSFPYSCRKQYYVNAYDVNDKQPRIELWALPTSVWEDVGTVAMSDDWADVLELASGHAFVITGTGEGFDREYKTTVDRQPTPVSPALAQQIVDPLEHIEDVGLEGQLKLLGCEAADLWPDGDAPVERVEPQTDVAARRSAAPPPPARPATHAPAASPARPAVAPPRGVPTGRSAAPASPRAAEKQPVVGGADVASLGRNAAAPLGGGAMKPRPDIPF